MHVVVGWAQPEQTPFGAGLPHLPQKPLCSVVRLLLDLLTVVDSDMFLYGCWWGWLRLGSIFCRTTTAAPMATAAMTAAMIIHSVGRGGGAWPADETVVVEFVAAIRWPEIKANVTQDWLLFGLFGGLTSLLLLMVAQLLKLPGGT